MDPKVSVVIPVYNVKNYLRECVESVKSQTYQNIEIFLIDDGSTDGSSMICDEIAQTDDRIKVIHKKNGGLSDARNKGYRIATGKYIYYLDSDDYIKAWAIADLVSLAEEKCVDVVFFDAYFIDENGNQILDEEIESGFYRTGKYDGIYTGMNLFELFLKYDDYSSAVPLSFIKKDVFHCPFAPIIHEDELFTAQLLTSVDSAVYYPARLYVRRVRHGSITMIPKTHAHFDGVAITIRSLCEIGMMENALRQNIIRLYHTAVWIYVLLPKEEKKMCLCTTKDLYRMVTDKDIIKTRPRMCGTIWLSFYNNYSKMHPWAKRCIKWGRRKISFVMKKRQYIHILEEIKAHRTSDTEVFLIGTPVHGNLGDHAIAIAEKMFLGTIFQQIHEIEMPFYRMCHNRIKKYIRPQDIIIISGGGWMGNQWPEDDRVIRDIVTAYPDNRIVIFPQTIFYEECDQKEEQISEAKQVYSRAENTVMCLRDKQSYDFAMQNGYQNAYYVPDIALYLKHDNFLFKRHGVLMIRRRDREKVVDDTVWSNITKKLCLYGCDVSYADTIEKDVSLEERERKLDRKLIELSQAQVIVTDRLHAMVFAAITATPCIAFDNSSKKVSGVYQWIKDLGYIELADSEHDVIAFVRRQMENNGIYHYKMPDYSQLREILMSLKHDMHF